MTVTMPLHGKSTASLNIPRNEDTAAYLTNDNTTSTYTIHSTNDLSIRSTFTRHNICTNCKCFSKWLVGFIRVTNNEAKSIQAPSLSKLGEDILYRGEEREYIRCCLHLEYISGGNPLYGQAGWYFEVEMAEG